MNSDEIALQSEGLKRLATELLEGQTINYPKNRGRRERKRAAAARARRRPRA